MIFLLIILMVVVGIPGYIGVHFYRDGRKQIAEFGYTYKAMEGLSEPARRILMDYKQTPVNNRPDGDIMAVLRALDSKYGGSEKVNAHYSRTNRYNLQSEFDWNDHQRKGGCTLEQDVKDRKCSMSEYKTIKFNLQEILKALEAQEHAFVLAGIQGQLDKAQNMIEQMKDERRIIKEVTDQHMPKELS